MSQGIETELLKIQISWWPPAAMLNLRKDEYFYCILIQFSYIKQHIQNNNVQQHSAHHCIEIFIWNASHFLTDTEHVEIPETGVLIAAQFYNDAQIVVKFMLLE